MEKVTAIIPTFNRFKYLMNTIKSIKEQTYPNMEIIVVNDCSTEKEYYEYNWEENGVTILHLKENSKKIFGFACAGYVRTKGIEISTGKYIAFCDDDDIWFPKKIELQMNAMKETGCKMSSTDGLIGSGVYDVNKKYKVYNAENFYAILKNIYRSKGSNLLDNGFPRIWNLDFLNIHNCVIASSAVVSKDILVDHKCIQNEPNGSADDYRIWLRALHHTNSVYVDDICFYYDEGHGYGQNL
jgi:glycosyltransferase involved in cell wall biosynthesis